jgi:hypothetical protein
MILTGTHFAAVVDHDNDEADDDPVLDEEGFASIATACLSNMSSGMVAAQT